MGEAPRFPPATFARYWRALLDSVGTRAFLQAALFVAVVVIAGSLVLWQLVAGYNRLLSRQVIETLKVEADALAGIARAEGAAGVFRDLSRRAKESADRIYWLEGPDGGVLQRTLRRWPDEVARPQAETSAIAGATFEYTPLQPGAGNGSGARHLAVGIALILPGDLRLLVGRDLSGHRRLTERTYWLYLIAFGALAIGGLLAGYLSSRLALGRIGEITATSDRILAGDLSGRVRITGSGDELDRLAGNLNAMLDRIESLMAGLREVSDNIAHDLKTPLTRLRARAEAALREGDGLEAREGLGRVIEDADELIKTFNALLLIARLEAGAVEASSEVFDVAALVRDVAELYEPVAEEAGLSLATLAEGEVALRANRQLVSQAAANMIDNAIKYGRPSLRPAGEAADITVRLAAQDGEVRIGVGDHGPGIPAADRERVLKRFVRLEASRTRPGTGLGLSLVAAVARLHGGRILLEDNAPGLRIVLALPTMA